MGLFECLMNRGEILSVAWGSKDILLPTKLCQTSRNLSMLDLPVPRAKASTDGLSAYICITFCCRNWPTVTRSFIIMAFYHNLLLLICIESVMDGHCLQTKIYLPSTVPQDILWAMEKSKFLRNPPLLLWVFCPLWTDENQHICASHTEEDGDSVTSRRWTMKEKTKKEKLHYRKKQGNLTW